MPRKSFQNLLRVPAHQEYQRSQKRRVNTQNFIPHNIVFMEKEHPYLQDKIQSEISQNDLI